MKMEYGFDLEEKTQSPEKPTLKKDLETMKLEHQHNLASRRRHSKVINATKSHSNNRYRETPDKQHKEKTDNH